MYKIDKNNTVLISGSSHELLAQNISSYLNIPLTPCLRKQFANTEWNIKIQENIRNKDVFIIQTGSFDKEKNMSINDFIMETVILINACRYSSCGKITLIMPCYPYARGDKKDAARTPISSRAIADILNIDRLVTIDLHSGQQQGFFSVPVDNIYSCDLVKEYFQNTIFKGMSSESKNKKYVIVSPDEGAVKRTLKFAGSLGIKNYEFCHKQRTFDKPGVIASMKLLGICDLSGMSAIICDDMCDSGGTLMKCVDLLVQKGVKEVYCVITHGIFTKNALQMINENPYIKRFIVTDTLPQEHHMEICSKLEVISVAELLGEIMNCLSSGESISELSCFKNLKPNMYLRNLNKKSKQGKLNLKEQNNNLNNSNNLNYSNSTLEKEFNTFMKNT